MLQSLSIKNYALINRLTVDFSDGMTTITGETGAGKSILLGALSLVLGKRADRSALYNDTTKCIVEAQFDVSNYDLKKFFEQNELDYEAETVLRREIIPNGKSRAFINDTPVTLDVLESLGALLVDVHSQHQTLTLTQNDFQFAILDAFANNSKVLVDYKAILSKYQAIGAEITQIESRLQKANEEQEYQHLLYQELIDANLTPDMQEPLEDRVSQLGNVEDLQHLFSEAVQRLDQEDHGLLAQLIYLKSLMQQAASKSHVYQKYSERLASVILEVQDLFQELESDSEGLEADPQALEHAQNKLQQLYALQKKHQVNTVADLIEKQHFYGAELQDTKALENRLDTLKSEVSPLKIKLEQLADTLHQNRIESAPKLVQELQTYLAAMGMQNAQLKFEIQPSNTFLANGKDQLTLLFSANLGSPYQPLKKVASGGELSRIMLAIKAILAQYQHLPTIIFDEIDTGVSGNISNEIAIIMAAMATRMQVFTITHLPQVAAKGKQQFKVYKTDVAGQTQTLLKTLSKEERVIEIAQMLSGDELTQTAKDHAVKLLN
ncbi:MAG: DNA repair protein RecN [Bacteroidetes bacterium]|nr:DNA repair protein RecN [Bacteroidota bacterium]MDA0937615.1 DNA repair protein RecN [Bacteroidota bacterium]MDA1344419.1 DNA repair protein RecN [Bacteroidota bacterium]